MRMQFAVSLLLLGYLSKAQASESGLKKVWYTSPQRSLGSEQLVAGFLESQSRAMGIDTQSLKLVRQQNSLLAHHLVYQQLINGLPVDGATIAVSVLKKEGAVYQYFSSLIPSENAIVQLTKSRIPLEQAYDAAWAYVGVQGKLFQAPRSTLHYKMLPAKVLKLVYSIELSPTEPYGSWGVDVDAATGEVVGVQDLRITERPIPIPSSFGSKRPTINRSQAFANLQKRSLIPLDQNREVRSGIARVFDPDPKTEMGSTTITDSSAASAFDAAYVDRQLLDMTFAGSNYSLKGPWVSIIDFDPPTAAPSTTKDGKWNFKRGQGGFTDAMTYFHLDQSQRYIQSLGFKDETGIQFKSIEVDADGVNGDDNSYFTPGTGRLSFGHGCVDDNEDADVILHEYGHALHFSINPNWGGGDSGAMGEGFGDYWAASYSFSTAKGAAFQTDIVYNWDAGSCWDGRVLDATDARYDPNKTYSAHSSITGGHQSDELWSTPIFQAHKALRALGVPREEIDTIILEAQFGLGSGVKMREMAQSIVGVAERLYPNGPHARVFREKFVDQGILVEARPTLNAVLGPVTDSDGIADPGESLVFPLTISNTGDKIANGVTVSVSSQDEFVSALSGNFQAGNLAAGKETSVNLGLTLSADTPCGHTVALVITLKDATGKSWVVPATILVGKPIAASVASNPNLPIPDKSTVGISSAVEIDSSATVSSRFTVAMNIKHSYRADLRVVLKSPQGKEIVLHDRSGFSEDNLIGVYPTTLTPKDSFALLAGQKLQGTWTLKVTDEAASDTGTLVSWGIEDVSGYECR